MKVRLPKEVAEAIDTLRQMNKPDSYLITVACNAERILYSHDRIIYDWCAEDNLVPFVRALLNGYEVEETPEDKVRAYIDHLKNKRDGTDLPHERCRAAEYSGRIDSVLTTLDLLNIKIEGVNA